MRSFIRSCLILAILFNASRAQVPHVTVISHGTLIDGIGGPPVPNSAVVIRGNTIAAVGTASTLSVPPGATIIDASGKFLLPGLIDTHVHLEMLGVGDVGDLPPEWSTPARLPEIVALNARLDLLAGFTTVRDLGSTAAVLRFRDRVDSGEVAGPRIIAAGMQLVKRSPDAEPNAMFLDYDGPDDARVKSRELVSLGVGVMKIRLTRARPIPSLEEVRAIVEEAHRHGLRATVHTDVPADNLVRLAIESGADGIEHNAPLRSGDERALADMAARRMSLMAGAGAFYVQRIDGTGLIDSLGILTKRFLPRELLLALSAGIDSLHRQTDEMRRSGWSAPQRQARFAEETRRARKAGVLSAFGTDCGAYGMIHGEQYKAIFGESQMGSTPMQAILMATRDAAAAVGKASEIGTVEAGRRADLIIVDGDPLTDLRNLRLMFRVVKDGVVYDPGLRDTDAHGK